MLRMADRHRQRVGGVLARREARRQQHAHHHRDLRLVGVAVAHDRLLDEIGGVFLDHEAGERGRGERDPARLPELQAPTADRG